MISISVIDICYLTPAHCGYDHELNAIALFQEQLPIYRFYLQANIPHDIVLFLLTYSG